MVNVVEVMERLAKAMYCIDTGGTFETMACSEADALAAALVVFGHDDAACHVLVEHSRSDVDEDSDDHFHIRELRDGDRGVALAAAQEYIDEEMAV